MDEWTILVTDPEGNEYQNIQQVGMEWGLRKVTDERMPDVVKGALQEGFRDIWQQIEREKEWDE
jgi:hypothetical protein